MDRRTSSPGTWSLRESMRQSLLSGWTNEIHYSPLRRSRERERLKCDTHG